MSTSTATGTIAFQTPSHQSVEENGTSLRRPTPGLITGDELVSVSCIPGSTPVTDELPIEDCFSEILRRRYHTAGIPYDIQAAENKLRLRNDVIFLKPEDCETESKVRVVQNRPLHEPELPGNMITTRECFSEIVRKRSESPHHPGSLFIMIPSLYSFGRLAIGYGLFQAIVRSLERSPDILHLVDLFGRKNDQINEDYPFFKNDGITKELTYNFTYAHLKKAKTVADGEDDWVLRKMGISAQSENFILFQPSKILMSSLEQLWAASKELTYNFAYIHLMIVEAANQNWVRYVNYLEERLMVLNMQTQCWNPRPPGVEDLFPDTFEFRDVPLIQSFKDHLLVTLQAIRINSENLLSLKEALSLSVEQSSWVNSISKELGQQEMRMRVLIERTTGIMDALPAMLARQDNLQTIDLAKRAADNARSVRAIAIVTMLFLPPSLIASIFGMASFGMENGRMIISRKYVGWFVGLTIFSLLITWFGWYSGEWLAKRSWKRIREQQKMEKIKGTDECA